MRYKLLGSGKAVIISREHEIVYDNFFITFSGAPSDATAILDVNGSSLYRKLEDGVCSIPANKLVGEIRVTVVILDGTTPIKRWNCEELKAETLRDGGTLVSPNDMNLPQKLADLELEYEHIRQTNERITKRLQALEDRLEKILEGYDLT